MADASNTSSSKANADRRWPTPDWDHLPFDVACARCGHSLRGLTEPKCPACGLEFDWSEAVPLEELTCLHCGYHLYGLIETRCPECGNPFTWEHVLDDYRRRKKPFFEYQWRRKPIRSFIASWWLAMRPSRLWRTIDIHDPPPLGSLALLFLISALLFTLSPIVLAYPGGWAVRLSEAFGSGSSYFYLGPWECPYHGWMPWFGFALFVGFWSAGGFGGLMVLRQSMSRCKVRNGHVVRAHVYAMLPVASAPTIYCIVAFVYDAGSAQVPPLDVHEDIGVALWIALVFLAWFWPVRSIALAYRLYIRMKHAWPVAIASQVIALLTGMIAMTWWTLLT